MRPRSGRLNSVAVGTKHRAIVLRMRADPEPQHPVARIDRERSIVGTDPGRVKPSDALEMQGGMARIDCQKLKLLVRERSASGG